MAQPPAHWSSAYVGKPYADANCAELACLVRAEVFDHHVTLPHARSRNVFALSEQIHQHQGDFAERTEQPRDGDAVLMRSHGRLNHIGLYCDLADGEPWVLHALRNTGQTCLHRLRDLKNLNIAIEGFYRWL